MGKPKKQEHHSWEAEGFKFAFDDNGSHFWQREVGNTGKFDLMKLWPEDLTPKCFLLMAKNNLSRRITKADLE